VRWISPSAVDPYAPSVPGDRFLLRVDEFRTKAVLDLRQGHRLLWQPRYARLVPACSIHTGASWIAHVDPLGPEITVELTG
jgi:hypothetical protein